MAKLSRRDFLKTLGILPAVPVVGKLDKLIHAPEPAPEAKAQSWTSVPITEEMVEDGLFTAPESGYYMITAGAFLPFQAKVVTLEITKNGEPIATQTNCSPMHRISLQKIARKDKGDVFDVRIFENLDGGWQAPIVTPVEFHSMRIF